MRKNQLAAAALAVLALLPAGARAQTTLTAPQPSPAASVSQTVGITRLEVVYHRPAVKGRQIWGGLVPYGQVWRAGANENTTFSASSAVKIGGKTLPAGTYGVHMLPTAKDWTVIFSKVNAAWGSFTYDPKEDALRVKVRPVPTTDFEERLSYRFDDPTDRATTLVLRWEKLAVPLRIEVDTPAVVMASMRTELRGLAQFFWQPWTQAANYWLQNGGNLDEAQRFAERAAQSGEHFATVRVLAAIADKKGDHKKAEALRARALEIAEEGDLNNLGYTLLAQKKIDEAIATFKRNVEAHPKSWNVYDSLAEAYMTKGDKAAAVENYTRALAMVKDAANKKRITETLARLKRE